MIMPVEEIVFQENADVVPRKILDKISEIIPIVEDMPHLQKRVKPGKLEGFKRTMSVGQDDNGWFYQISERDYEGNRRVVSIKKHYL